MENQTDNHPHILNRGAIASLGLGGFSLLPYAFLFILDIIFSYSTDPRAALNNTELIFALYFYSLGWGAFFGITSIIIGFIGIKRINKSEEKETGFQIAIIGIVLGVIAILVNIWFVYGLISGLKYD